MAGKTACVAAAFMLALNVAAHAAPDPSTVAAEGNVTHYDPAYFTESHPSTAYDMIRRLPGFSFDDGGSARGFAGNAGNVVIDGQRPTAKTDDLQTILTRIPASDVARIDVIRGSAPGINMHGQSVLANVIRKSAPSTTIVAQTDANIWATGHTVYGALLSYSHQAIGWEYEASIQRLGNFDDSYGAGSHVVTDGAGNVTRQDEHNVGSAEGWQLNGAVTMPLLGGKLKTNLTMQTNPFDSAFVYTSPGYLAYVTDESRGSNAEAGIRWTKDWSDYAVNLLFLQRLGHATDLNISVVPGDDQQFSAAQNTGESIARATLRYNGIKDLSIETGGEAVYNYLYGRSLFTDNGVEQPIPGSVARVTEQRGEFFSEGTWKFAPEWSLQAGARFEFSTIGETGDVTQSRSLFYPKPRAILSWSPDADTQWRLRYERVVGQLDFNNFAAASNLSTGSVIAGNANLLPDDHQQYALSYERHFMKKGALVVTLQHDQISDAVDRIPVFSAGTFYDAPGNIGAARDDMIDVEATLPLDWLGLKGGLVKSKNIWRDSAVTDPVTGQTRRLSNERPHAIQVSLSQDLTEWKSTWEIDFDDVWDQSYFRVQQYEHDQVKPPYLQAYWDYKPTPDWALHFEVDNIVPYFFKIETVTYTGLRGQSPVAQIEDINIRSRPRIFIRLRKTFD